MSANEQTLLLEVLLGGFFAVACIRASVRTGVSGRIHWSDLLRLPGRIERLRRTRWQWFSMAGLMLVLRLQNDLPLVLEGMAVLQFAIFLALPNRVKAEPYEGSRNEAAVGTR